MSDFHNTSVDALRRADALSKSADALDGQRLSSFSSRVAIFSALVLLVSQIHAQKPAIPEPLTLVDALTIARDQPLLQLHHRATIELGEARVAATRASLDYRIGLVLEPRTVAKGSALTSGLVSDGRYSLSLTTTLSDFGQSESRHRAANAQLASDKAMFHVLQDARHIDVMERFFSVLLADLHFYAQDEKMTMAFLRFKRARERRERFDAYSTVEVQARESDYQAQRVRRLQSDLARQRTRHYLAVAMGRSNSRSRDLVRPNLADYNDRPLPDYQVLLSEALHANPALRGARVRVEAATQSLLLSQRVDRPRLTGELSFQHYDHFTGFSRDRVRALLQLRVPLVSVEAHERLAHIERAAHLASLEAELIEETHRVQLQLTTLIDKLRINQVARIAAEVEETYRSAYQDRSRSLYEMEVKADLGDAQAQVAEALWKSAKVEFENVILWSKLDALLGRPMLLDGKGGTG